MYTCVRDTAQCVYFSLVVTITRLWSFPASLLLAYFQTVTWGSIPILWAVCGFKPDCIFPQITDFNEKKFACAPIDKRRTTCYLKLSWPAVFLAWPGLNGPAMGRVKKPRALSELTGPELVLFSRSCFWQPQSHCSITHLIFFSFASYLM